MQRDDVLRVLTANREALKELGVKSLFLFGSVARGEATPASDIDLLVEFDRPTGLFGLIRLEEHLEGLLGRKVDLGTLGGLRPSLRGPILAEGVRVA